MYRETASGILHAIDADKRIDDQGSYRETAYREIAYMEIAYREIAYL